MGTFSHMAAVEDAVWTEQRTARRAAGRALASAAAGLSLLSLVLGAFFVGDSQASADTPARAKLSTSLSGASGSTAAAYYVDSGASTTVVKWPGTYVYGSHAAGTPCSTYDLPPGATSERVIYAAGNYRKCA